MKQDKYFIEAEEHRLEMLRLKDQKIKLKKYTLFKIVNRKLYSFAGIINYKLNVYQKWDKTMKKRKTFTSYHDKKLATIKRRRYDPYFVNYKIENKLSNMPYTKIKTFEPSRQLTWYWYQKAKKNLELFTKIPELETNYDQNTLAIHIDDSYSNMRVGSKVKKMRFRMFNIVLYGENAKPKTNIVLYETAFFKQFYSSKTRKIEIAEAPKKANLTKYTEAIKKVITKYDIKYNQIRICSDGARWIKKLAKINDWDHQLDNFHFKKQLISVLGINKTLYKRNKEALEPYINANGVLIYKTATTLLKMAKIDSLNEFIKELIDSKLITCLKKLQELKALHRYISNNKQELKNLYCVDSFPTIAETHIYHFFKKITKRRQGCISYESLKDIFRYRNSKNIAYIEV